MCGIKIIVKDGLGALPRYLRKYDSVFVVYDRNVESVIEKIQKFHFSHIKACYPLIASENCKTLDQVVGISRWLMEQGADRSSLLLNVGGGITSDLGGFAASIYKRGIAYANLPTTLLAQVDAGIGGKTGVNLDNYKNMLGVIRQPVFTYICPELVRTLPEKEYKSGLAELLKTFLIKDAKQYHRLMFAINQKESIDEFIGKAAKIKAKIVRRDPNEKGIRRILNLGHTYGHAIEWYQHKYQVSEPYTHG